MMARLKQILLRQFLERSQDAAAGQRPMQHRIDFVERQPQLDFVLIPIEDRPRVLLVETDQVMADPTVVLLGKVERRLVMADRHERLHAQAPALVEQIVVEFEPRLVGLIVVAVRENARPRNRRAEDFEAHLGEELEIVLIAVIEVDRDQLEIVGRGLLGGRALDAVRHDVLNVDALAVLNVSALDLIGGDRSAPQEILRECHNSNLLEFIYNRITSFSNPVNIELSQGGAVKNPASRRPPACNNVRCRASPDALASARDRSRRARRYPCA